MESTPGQQEGERSRPPFPRAASRSSTSSTKTRSTHISSQTSFTRLPPSPQQGAAHPTHRFHHSACSRDSAERPRSQLSREASEDSRQSLLPVSNFLQERLQKERKESERSSSRLSNETMNASYDQRTTHSSPVRSGASDGRRPRSSGGTEPVKKSGLGVKEMEKTLSTLHKQNFDLKLELYHRRERQTALEERLEKLETEKIQTDEMNDKLLVEMEKRDKAVEEAVAMIVSLEARVEQLLREREMVREIDTHRFYYSRDETPTPTETQTPRRRDFERLNSDDDAKLLARMPSFLSEQSEATSNLRNVYLGVQGSVLSLSKMVDDGHNQGRDDLEGTRSPSLSVLSESSFRSIYGEKDAAGLSNSSSGPYHLEPAPFDGLSEDVSPRFALPGDNSKIVTPSKLRRVESRNMSTGASKFQHINNILDVAGSPLQRLEQLEKTLTAMDDESRPSTAYERKTDSRPSTGRPVKPGAQFKTKQEKRDALEKVLTNGPLSRDYGNTQGLPPTPDTISTSTLRRFKNSNDTLPKEPEVGERSYLALSETTTTSQLSSAIDNPGGLGVPGAGLAQPPSTSAFDGLKELSSDNSYFNGRFSSAQLPRPRSADETTISNRRGGCGRGNWESDESDDELDGAGSTSTFDPWMRESLNPNRTAALNPFSSASQTGNKQDGRISPDLFSFPTSTSGWATDAMFGTLGGNGYIGSGGGGLPTATPLAQTLDALGDSLPQPLFGSGLASPVLGGAALPPPPPNRRSSLHARTGSSHGMITGISSSPAGPSPSQSRPRASPRRNRERSNSIDRPPNSSHGSVRTAAKQIGRAPTAPPQSPTPVPDAPQQQPAQKQRHYPPTASQPTRSRGLNNLFRRSTGSSADVQPSSNAPATETSFKNIPAAIGVPTSWSGRKNATDIFTDDDRASATPPPIMRNRRGSFDGGAPVGVTPGSSEGQSAQAASTAKGPASGGVSNGATGGAPANEGGGKKKWFGPFGRTSSLKNRAG
ncbi:hypothetical protein GE09DRAFT_33259 [Coniochaeta sp. 2T2.1]|nr:hypothetical protein GE09DRAFT_33259 [Coniochaeta sp. 2T2.1]